MDEAVDRELFNGNLSDAQTLSRQGERVLEEHLGHPNDLARTALKVQYACRAHVPCWTISCDRCLTAQFEHIIDEQLEEHVEKVIAGHVCPSTRAEDRLDSLTA